MWVRGHRAGARQWSPWCGVALGAIVLAACGASTPVARGFGSREVLPIRDPTFAFSGWGENVIDYSTEADGGFTNGTIVFGPQPDAGPPAGDGGSVVPALYSCQPGMDAQGNFTTLIITNNVTGQQTTVDDVHGILQCPGADLDLDHPATRRERCAHALERPLRRPPADTAAGDDRAARRRTSTAAVKRLSPILASLAAQPDAVGLFSIDTATFAVTMLVPPTLGTAAWASGAAATTSALSSAEPVLAAQSLWPRVVGGRPLHLRAGDERRLDGHVRRNLPFGAGERARDSSRSHRPRRSTPSAEICRARRRGSTRTPPRRKTFCTSGTTATSNSPPVHCRHRLSRSKPSPTTRRSCW